MSEAISQIQRSPTKEITSITKEQLVRLRLRGPNMRRQSTLFPIWLERWYFHIRVRRLMVPDSSKVIGKQAVWCRASPGTEKSTGPIFDAQDHDGMSRLAGESAEAIGIPSTHLLRLVRKPLERPQPVRGIRQRAGTIMIFNGLPEGILSSHSDLSSAFVYDEISAHPDEKATRVENDSSGQHPFLSYPCPLAEKP
ncbi:hypothetical protein DL95DRAFT_408963 [Leptodontidium sp. 2 PMI_412]|nr:hypothetical protein DL95DRAFT_408963 [Leptodontidium sp. 2 PMI_412]